MKKISQGTIVTMFVPKLKGFVFQVISAELEEITNATEGIKFPCFRPGFPLSGFQMPLSVTSVGKPGTAKEVAFTKTETKYELRDGETLAALIGMDEEGRPHLICVAKHDDWLRHKQEAKRLGTMLRAEASAPQSLRDTKSLPKPSKPKGKTTPRFSSAPIVRDSNKYLVWLGNTSFNGTVTEIMTEVCRARGEDPSRDLSAAAWSMLCFNGGYPVYNPSLCPKLPPPNMLAIEIGKKLATTA